MQPRLLKHPARLAGASLLRLQDDARLVALAREGHDPAFAAIVDRYGRQLERYCARLLGPGRAEDAVQQAFVNAHAAMRASEQELALKPWLYRIAHNAALNILRASREEDDALDLDRPGATQTPEVVELRERLRETFAAIQALPAAQRDALLLRELEGRSHEEIALALGVSEGGARQHLHRARVAVRAAASAVTPYPVLARVLSAAAAEGGRSSDLVSGAGLGAGAGAMKVAAGVLAAGAIAGGAVGVHQHRSTPAHARSAAAGHSRSTTAPSEANGPSATPLEVADITSAGATASHGRGRDQGGARGHDRGRRHEHGGGREQHGSFVSGDHSGTHGSDGGHSGSSGGGSSGGEHIASKDDSSKSGSGGSGSGSHDSGSGAGSGSDDTTTEASHEESTTTTSDGGSSGSGSGDSLSSEPSGSSGSDDGGSSTTSTTSTEGSGSSGSSGSSDRTTTTSDH